MSGLLDALDYAGSIADKFGGRAVRGLLAGKPRELLSPIPFSDALGITDPSQITRGHELATKLGLVGEDDPVGQAAVGLGTEIATDPLTYLGGFGAHRALSRAIPEAAGASKWSTLKGLREPSMLLKAGDDARIIGRRLDRAANPGVDDRLFGVARAMHEAAPAHGRMNSPWMQTPEGSPSPFRNFGYSTRPQTTGHEIGHALTKNAALMGGEESLPLFGKMAARQYRAGGFQPEGFHMGVGDILDEMNSHGLDTRKTSGYARGALGFALSPEKHQLYHPQIAGKSPLAAGLFHAAPGAIPGAIGGAAVGGEQGYEQGGPGGALAGALAGGVGGAAVGGGLSHLRYAPNALNKVSELQRLASGESASRALKGYDRVMPYIDRKGTPINRFRSLSEAAGVGFKVPQNLDDLKFHMGNRDISGVLASYDPWDKVVTPNIEHFPHTWSDSRAMAEQMKKLFGEGHFSTQLADHLAIHEIQHALHHRRDIGNYDFFGDVNELGDYMKGAGHGGDTASELWRSSRPNVIRSVSNYGWSKPTEFVAERGSQRVAEAATGEKMRHPSMGMGMDALYKALKGPELNTGLMNEMHRLYGGDLERAIRGESGSLHLKYDVPPEEAVPRRGQSVPFGPEHTIPPRVITPESVGLSRTDPEWVNNRTFYHGTATPGLSPQNLDIMKTSPGSMHGRGIYTTEEAGDPTLDVTKGYGEARAEELNDRLKENHFSQSKVIEAMQGGVLPDELMKSVYKILMPGVEWSDHGNTGHFSRRVGRNTNILQGLGHSLDATSPEEIQRLMSDPSIAEIFKIFGVPQKAKPTIYQAQSDFGKILDLDQNNPSFAKWLRGNGVDTSSVRPGESAGEHYMAAREGVGDAEALKMVRDQGYDSLTHTGGGRWNSGDDPHQVVIGLDPRKYRKFEELPKDELARIFGNESASLGGSGDNSEAAARAAWDKVSPILRTGEKLGYKEKFAVNDAFANAVDAMKLPTEVEKRVYDARHNLETYGDPWASADKQLADGMMAKYGTDYGDIFGNESASRFRTRDLQPGQQDELYDLFKNSYEKSVGQAWPRSIFDQRSRGWDFWGNQPGQANPGFITTRDQGMGLMTKLTGAAGHPKGVLSGMHELLGAKGDSPIWGVMPEDLGRHMGKAGFKSADADLVQALARDVPQLGAMAQEIRPDGSLMVPTAGGLSPVQKRLYANQPYLDQMLNNPMFAGQFSPQTRGLLELLSRQQ